MADLADSGSTTDPTGIGGADGASAAPGGPTAPSDSVDGAPGPAPVVPSRCDQGGPEIIVGVVPVAQGDQVKLRIVLCQAAFRLSVDLDGQRLVDQDPYPGDEANVLLPQLAPGIHHLTWGYLAAGSTWKTLSEVSADGLVRFRLRKGSDSDRPFNFSSVTLRVV